MSNNLEKRETELKKLIREKEHALQKSPSGSLRVTTINGFVRYYYVEQKWDEKLVYLSKKQLRLVKRLAQKSYDQQVLDVANKELQAIEAYEKKMPKRTAEDVYESLSPARQELVTPIEKTDEEFIKEWTSVEWDHNWYYGEKPTYPTTNGEFTRSKSEALMADMYHRNGWYYRYEYPIRLKEHGVERTWHPDFILLDVKNRKEIVVEHFGMLHDPKYRKRMIEKMETYRENGYREGDNIIYTFESEEKQLDIARLEKYLQNRLS